MGNYPTPRGSLSLSLSFFIMPPVARAISPPSTAAVLEYQCLFTHDLRRKQKRWQDGRLKYHTFNKRIMVYDERGNFVGDVHWHHDYALDEGEEVQLERGGVIVQVSSLVARKEADLSELLDKRAKEKEQRQIRQVVRSPAPTAVLPRSVPRPLAGEPDNFQLQHRPLHRVIGTPTGHHGRAIVPSESPFERRQQAAASAAEMPDERAAKRRRHEDLPPSKSGYAASLFGQSLTLSAMPASSMSVNRQPRAEPSAGPSRQASLPSAENEVDSIPHEKPRMSRHLNQKSGYTQGLFGQSLTLSHTPVSSVAPRRQPWDGTGSSSTRDTDTREDQDGHLLALKEHPKASRHFNQPASRAHTGRSGQETSAHRKFGSTSSELTETIIPRGNLKEHLTIPRDCRVEEPKHSAPEDDDVIEIDDPGASPVRAARQPRRENGTWETATLNQRTSNMSKVTTPQHDLSRGKSAASQPAEKEGEEGNETEKEPAQTKRKRPVASKPATNGRTTDHAALKTDQDSAHSFSKPRRPDEHVTELRIKSRKRGLLMISDAPKRKPRQEPQAKDEDDHDHFRSPPPRKGAYLHRDHATGNSGINTSGASGSDAVETDETSPSRHTPNEDGESDDEEPRRNSRQTRARRTVSTELGEFIDPFRSPLPLAQEQPIYNGEPTTRDDIDQRKQPDTGTLHEFDVELPPNVDDDAIIGQVTAHPSPPPTRVYDPYRIPSSPVEKEISWPASSPGTKSPPINGKKGPAVRGAHKAGQKHNAATKAKKQRPSRKKFVPEDEEVDMLPSLSEKTLVSLSDPEDDVPGMNASAPTKQSNPKKTAGANRRKPKMLDGIADLEADDQKLVEATKQRAKKHHHQESQDEQAGKRRRSTRQRRNQVDEFEESSLTSEQEFSEEEQIPKKRQCKAAGTSMKGPRLESISRNIKSRELIGFNLETLNAQLGPREIGMPFSILSSPANEPIPKSNGVVEGTIVDPIVEDGDEQTSTIAFSFHPTTLGPDLIDGDESLSAALGGRPTISTPSPPAVNVQVLGSTTSNRGPPQIIANVAVAEAQPAKVQREFRAQGANEQLVTVKNTPANASRRTGDKFKHGSSRSPNYPDQTEITAMVPSREHHLVFNPRAKDSDKTNVYTKALTPQSALSQDPALSAASTVNPVAQTPTLANQRQRSSTTEDTSPDIIHPQVAAGTTETTEPTPPAIAATKPIALLPTSITDLQQWPSTNERANNADPEAKQSREETTESNNCKEAFPAAQIPLGPPTQKSIFTIRQQPSTTTPENDGKVEAGRHDSGEPEDVRIERAASPVARSRVTAPYKKPIPVMRRQPSTTKTANDVQSSLAEEKSDTACNDRSSSTCASAAPYTIDAPLQKPTLTGVRSLSSGMDITEGEFDISGETSETKQTPTGSNQRHQVIGLRRHILASRRVNNITAVPPQGGKSEDQTSDSTAKSAGRIVNPASRGRKAALASDAVGQVPQRVLPPTQPALLVPISTADLACTPFEPPPKEPERPKKKMKFPGFQSARVEGPWSREAFDLLESGRPG